MLVYGDHRETADPRRRLDEIGAELENIAGIASGLDRHTQLVSALIETGRVVQGLADAEAPGDELSQFLYRLAQAVVRSYDSHFADIGELPTLPPIELPRRVELRVPEGFAFYAVYPEDYIEAARRLELSGPARVIGIRSIGTTLGAIVASALDAPPPVTVRPFGDPFARQVELPSDIIEDDAHYVIVDEGPGLSGSSFGSVADWLQERDVPLERMAFLPSHAGDLGPKASDAHRERWRCAQRVPAEFNPSFLFDRFGPLQEFPTGEPWERRKFLGAHEGQPVLLKFAGLGTIGERKLQMAQRLFADGLVPEPIGLVHGFIAEHWREDARPLDESEAPVAEIARYIAARGQLPPAAPGSGASIEELLEMARRNVSLEFGDDAARLLDRWEARLADLQMQVVRIPTDNKLDRIEWLRASDGALIKTDSLDHHCAHDLIGCQDISWDLAGAIVEFDLDPLSAAKLVRDVEAAARIAIDRELIDFSLVAYLAFRLGQARLGAQSTPKLNDAATRYATRLHQTL